MGPSYRNFDVGLASTPVDTSLFADHWINTSDSPQGWHSLRTSIIDGAPTIHARILDGTIVEIPKIVLYGGIGSPELAGFSGEIGSGDERILLQGNLNLGLLVLATFKFPASGKIGYFSREFFARSFDSETFAPAGEMEFSELFQHEDQPASIDPAALLGSWRNADAVSRGLLEIATKESETGVSASALASPLPGSDSPVDWGTSDVDLFACLDEAGHASIAALARWEFTNLRAHLQLRVPGGTLAVAGFNQFRDGRMNYATREFFFRRER